MTSESLSEAPAASRLARRGASSFGWWMDASAVALSGAVILGFMLLSYLSPPYADDWGRLLDIRDHSFLSNIASRYMEWCGRLLYLALDQVALRFQLFWGIANGLAVVALVILTFAVAMGRWPRIVRRDLQVVAVVLAAYWFALPVIGQTFFWRSAAPIYLWPAWLMLLFVFPYRRWISTGAATAGFKHWRRAAPSLGLFVLGFVVGSSQEQVIAALCLLFVVFVVTVWQRGLRNVPAALVAGVIGAALGAAVLVFAPGNEVRLVATGTLSLTLFERTRGFAFYVKDIFVRWLPPFIPWLLCFLVAAVPMRQTGRSERDNAARPRAWWIWGLTAVATLAPFVYTPVNGPERTFFFVPVLLTVSVLSLAADGTRRALDRLPAAATSIAIAGLMLCMLVATAGGIQRATLDSKALRERAQFVSAQKAHGIEDVVVPPMKVWENRLVMFRDLTSDPNWHENARMAKWYGVHSIVVDSVEEP